MTSDSPPSVFRMNFHSTPGTVFYYNGHISLFHWVVVVFFFAQTCVSILLTLQCTRGEIVEFEGGYLMHDGPIVVHVVISGLLIFFVQTEGSPRQRG